MWIHLQFHSKYGNNTCSNGHHQINCSQAQQVYCYNSTYSERIALNCLLSEAVTVCISQKNSHNNDEDWGFINLLTLVIERKKEWNSKFHTNKHWCKNGHVCIPLSPAHAIGSIGVHLNLIVVVQFNLLINNLCRRYTIFNGHSGLVGRLICARRRVCVDVWRDSFWLLSHNYKQWNWEAYSV